MPTNVKDRKAKNWESVKKVHLNAQFIFQFRMALNFHNFKRLYSSKSPMAANVNVFKMLTLIESTKSIATSSKRAVS